MKLPQLLKQFLYQNKRLSLPRIGNFQMDETVQHFPENPKQQSLNSFEITFNYDPAEKEDPELVDFISANTGKMKPLASSDLSSFIEISIQFLNIGKMFKLEGIGTLIKTMQNDYKFTPEKFMTGKMMETSMKEILNADHEVDDLKGYDALTLDEKPNRFTLRNLVFISLSIIGLVIVVWGINYLNKKTVENNISPTEQLDKTTIVPIFEDTTTVQQAVKDSVLKPIDYSGIVNFKFILEIANRTRAMDRYNQLKSYNWDIKMETTDSVQFTLYVNIPALAMDTTSIKDSLNLLSGNKVFIRK